jgi:hypothetical protein
VDSDAAIPISGRRSILARVKFLLRFDRFELTAIKCDTRSPDRIPADQALAPSRNSKHVIIAKRRCKKTR